MNEKTKHAALSDNYEILLDAWQTLDLYAALLDSMRPELRPLDNQEWQEWQVISARIESVFRKRLEKVEVI